LSETFIIQHAVQLIERGHDVTMFAFKSDPDKCPHEEVARFALLEKTRLFDEAWKKSDSARMARRLWLLGRRGLREPGITLKALDPRVSIRSALTLETFICSQAMRDNRTFDIVHCHFGWSGVHGARLKRAGAFDGKLLVTYHGADVSADWGVGSTSDRALMYAEADGFTANTEFILEQAVKLGCPRERCAIWHMGVDISQFAFKERMLTGGEPVRILTVGRMVEKKGVEYVLRALRDIKFRGRPVEYHIVGDGQLRSHLEGLARELGPHVKAVFHGALSAKDVRKQLELAHIFILTSVTAANRDREGQPVSILEAQACGLPVISTFHAGIPEAVAPETLDYLVEERDIAATAERLDTLLANPSLWGKLGRAGRKFVEDEFALSRCTDKLLTIYDRLRYGGQVAPGR
jgi:colanic acid/amylovoran biosynthesis glycosyltransferase